MIVTSAYLSDPGLIREKNEDFILADDDFVTDRCYRAIP